jgi:hypothetical protein
MSFNLRKPITLDSISNNKMISKTLLRTVQGAAKNMQGTKRIGLVKVMEQAIETGFRQMAKEWGKETTVDRLIAELQKNTELCKVIAELGIPDSRIKELAQSAC